LHATKVAMQKMYAVIGCKLKRFHDTWSRDT